MTERGRDMTVDGLLPLAQSPPLFQHPDLDQLSAMIVAARRADPPVVDTIGGHPIKLGLPRFLIDLIQRSLITHMATNDAGIILDCELALAGGSSEKVANWIPGV